MEILNFDKSKLITEIQNALSEWQSMKPDVRTIAYLARETGVTESSIRRISNNGIKIADDSIFKLLSFICGEYKYEKFLQYYHQKNEVKKWFMRNYSYMANSPALQEYKPTSISADLAANSISYSVYMYIRSLSSVTSADIKEQFGVRGEIELEKQISKGHIKQEGENLRTVNQEKILFSKDEIIDLIPSIATSYLKKDHLYNSGILETGGLSKEGYIKMMDIQQDFLEKTVQIYQDYPGSIPSVTVGFFDSFTQHPYFEGGKNETNN